MPIWKTYSIYYRKLKESLINELWKITMIVSGIIYVLLIINSSNIIGLILVSMLLANFFLPALSLYGEK